MVILIDTGVSLTAMAIWLAMMKSEADVTWRGGGGESDHWIPSAQLWRLQVMCKH